MFGHLLEERVDEYLRAAGKNPKTAKVTERSAVAALLKADASGRTEDLSLVETDKLMEEVMRRYDACFFVGERQNERKPVSETYFTLSQPSRIIGMVQRSLWGMQAQVIAAAMKP